MPTPDEWQHEIDEALFGTDEAEALPDRVGPASLDFPPTPEAGSWPRDDDMGKDLFGEEDPDAVTVPVSEQGAWQPAPTSGTQSPRVDRVDAVDSALFGGAAASTRTAPAAPEAAAPSPIELPVLNEADAAPFAAPDEATVVDPDGETIIAELADDADAAGPTDPGRRGRRVWVLGAFTALVVIIGGTAGAVIAGQSGSTRPGRKTVSDHTTATTATTAPVVTTTPVPATTAPAVTAPPPAPTAPRTPATSRRTVPPPAPPSVDPEPPPPAPPPSEPPPSTSPPSTSPLP